MGIHKIIRIAEGMISNYENVREEEKMMMIYSLGRLQSATDSTTALDILRGHLDKHYQPKYKNELFDYAGIKDV